jgi:hypothetical protein
VAKKGVDAGLRALRDRIVSLKSEVEGRANHSPEPYKSRLWAAWGHLQDAQKQVEDVIRIKEV